MGRSGSDDSHAPATGFIVRQTAFSLASSNIQRFWQVVFIVQGKLGGLAEPVKVIRETRVEAWEAVSDLLDRRMSPSTPTVASTRRENLLSRFWTRGTDTGSNALDSCFDAFSSREPVSTSLATTETAPVRGW